ncbi:hypothetical protein [Carboxylicivirga marina]|uniref:Uncharacterized protein n=1 Tax=Carboxylicivirga marina TaxID=2800988 RepID=A0ABS1HJD9_9BACT|nr:hypothetical protein [Carboxylicivirga marina]MBK3517793.1 hypothetical protein [Carboxylicivirga marina]
MKTIIAYSLLVLSLLSVSCTQSDDGWQQELTLTKPIEPITKRSIILSSNNGLKGESLGLFSMQNWYEYEFDEDKLVHSYETSGYTVKVFNAWIVSAENPQEGYYDDIEFENINLNDQSIEFETAGPFSIEVIHPDYVQNKASQVAYYGFEVNEFDDWPGGQELIIPMELRQFATLLVFRSVDVRFTIEKMEIEKIEVEEYQPIYIEMEKDFTIEVEHRNGGKEKVQIKAGNSGECKYYWVESVIFE